MLGYNIFLKLNFTLFVEVYVSNAREKVDKRERGVDMLVAGPLRKQSSNSVSPTLFYAKPVVISK
jgi:hypothetical protein